MASEDRRDIEERLLTFLNDQLLAPDRKVGLEVGREDELLTEEILDSMAVVRLGAFVEEAFRIRIQPADFVIENFRNVATIARFIQSQSIEETGSDAS